MIPDGLAWLPAWLGWILFVAITAATIWAAGHALLFKREPRAALGWVTFCLLFPVAGPLGYYLFGINRIRTRARKMRASDPEQVRHRPGTTAPDGLAQNGGRVGPNGSLPDIPSRDLLRISAIISGRDLLPGNRLQVLENGEGAYPQMLDTIRSAERRVYLTTYLFETNGSGGTFVDVLAGAVERGVDVRVLVDGVGECYSFPRVSTLLRRRGVPVARFLPPRLVPPQVNINLRNHRKILVVDSRVGFTGGMNIGDRHLVGSGDAKGRVQDLHFRVEGPVVTQLEEAFLDDWEFVTGESIEPRDETEKAGDSWARVIVDGPDTEVDQLLTILTGAIAVARDRVWIMTPYFAPPREVVEALKTAALRDVDIRVVVPDDNNIPYVDWASRNMQRELLEWGIRIFYQRPPMAHTKLLVVDDDYLQIGSANVDTRSLRLNFELVMEICDRELADWASSHIRRAAEEGHEVTREELDLRPLWIRLRDAAAGLFTPYL